MDYPINIASLEARIKAKEKLLAKEEGKREKDYAKSTAKIETLKKDIEELKALKSKENV